VERGGHQHARPRHGLQRIHHILRVKRLAAPEAAAAVQCQQEGGLKTVTVLHRHGAHENRSLANQTEPFSLGPPVLHQPTPSLGVRLRQAG
jgi:hypothetical protein